MNSKRLTREFPRIPLNPPIFCSRDGARAARGATAHRSKCHVSPNGLKMFDFDQTKTIVIQYLTCLCFKSFAGEREKRVSERVSESENERYIYRERERKICVLLEGSAYTTTRRIPVNM